MKKLLILPVLAGVLMFSAPVLCHAEEMNMQKIEENQQQILKALEEIKAELQIVKVRVTSR